MPSNYDVIVVGGGFAGSTAARELQHRGLRTVLLEARDRLGGRTWSSEFAGKPVEMGGTWVHWHQPHVWAEIRRYGLELAESFRPTRSGWVVGRELKQGPAEQLWGMINEGATQLCLDSRDVLERPHDPLFKDISDLDALSIQDRMEKLPLDRETSDVNDGLWSTCCSAHCRETGLVAALRWYALSGYDADLLWDCAARYKIATGTKSLVEAIATDGGFELRLSTPVASIEHDDTGVVVRTRDGETFDARAVVVALPVNALKTIEFTPELSGGKRAMATEGQSSHGVKIWIRVRGTHDYFATAPSTYGITYLQTEYHVDGDTLFVSFGPDASMLDPTDKDAVAKVVDELLPGHEVVDVYAHNWTGDEFTQGTWSMYRPNQLTRYLRELQKPDGRLFLSGSDTANGWNGFIDGAIESGLSAGRNVAKYLAA
jgi:monoamine oxidase